ncbi:hypothetical protein [Pseudohalioglobus lutimaris]|uniref:Class I SAM-dependent methyltransferase n=1 Tax=Pseudohalioglobus lutimaris TaxID=1737061 RepID=A0A2N5WY43_9GAMM|nr:hypothetical protein [Pseudohalioglobus lutimaris]PLW67155.1 hypothetical protein C0039_18270 [Pseudohalioglobus lutimaris]
MNEQQSSQLLPDVFAALENMPQMTILHVGPVQPETMAFLSGLPCRLYNNDLFAELPLAVDEEDEQITRRQLRELLFFPHEVRFDLCLFWDLFNYLDAEAVSALMDTLRPHLAPGAFAHCFGVHNTRSPQQDYKYSMVSSAELLLRPRPAALPGYAPHSQGRLNTLLDGFEVQRSVLLAQSRLELLLRARTATP